MLKNYFKLTLRKIKKRKTISLINIVGLSVGIACAFTIYLFINYEKSFESFYNNADRIYRIAQNEEHHDGVSHFGGTPYPLAEAIKLEFPELEAATKAYFQYETQLKYNNDLIKIENYVFVDEDFLTLFNVDFLKGSYKDALIGPNKIVLTESEANRIFNSVDVIGKTVNYENKTNLKVSGIIKDIPSNTHMPFNALISMESLVDDTGEIDLDSWKVSTSTLLTFILAPKVFNKDDYTNKLTELKNKYYHDPDNKVAYVLQPLKDIHLSDIYPSLNYKTSRTSLLILSIIGLLILGIAVINFINLTTAQTIKRNQEVGLRKVFGATKNQLIIQFLSDALLFTTIACIISIIATFLLLPQLNNFLGNKVNVEVQFNLEVLAFVLGSIVIVSLVAGIYPAIVMTKIKPVKNFENKFTSNKGSSSYVKNGLVTLQFVICQVLIISTFILSEQMELFYTGDLGYSRDGVLSIELEDNQPEKLSTLANILKESSDVKNVTFASGTPISKSNYNIEFSSVGKNSENKYYGAFKAVDKNYVETIGLELLSGRTFTHPQENEKLLNVLVNSTLIKKLKLGSPSGAIGQKLKFSKYECEIIGVIKDFYVQSMKEEIQPVILSNNFSPFHSEAIIKFNTKADKEVLQYAEASWKKVFPNQIFEYRFLDEYIKTHYENEEKFLTLVKVFSIIALVLGNLGILGLITFIVIQKKKEIGIRKVLGSSVGNILALISRDFAINVLVASLIAFPIAYFFLSDFLADFANRVELNLLTFIISSLIVLLITVITISIQSITAALANPVESLRNE